MENLLSDRGKAIQELERGREFATQLRRLILNSSGEGDGEGTTPFAQDLADKVLTSFSNALLLLNLHSHDSQMQQHFSCLLPAKSDDSEDSCKSTSAVKERARGSYKRRRTSQTSEIDSETPIDDGHAWRKYGQKNIMNAPYPRNYFRCSHRFDQGCQATKQVQRIQEKPELYRTTYHGHHTCSRNSLNSDIILDANSPSRPSIFISFDNNLPAKQAFFSSSSSSSLPTTKTQCKEEIPSSSSEDYLLSPESSHEDPISDMLYGDLVFGPEPFDF
ncbi:probable WRKY transcription factor 70 [Prosopis cineraria]|uniref:probable WRKY transcription factor 70 n=1 Tax=Prosopis cineraria TaxID=364024 RepID=UPI00240FD696|nr:probable WRKY transcription factor 70 [Prosopis cineraria]